MLPDLWTTCDLPVLVELVRRLEYDGEQHVFVNSLEVDGLKERQVEGATRRLRDSGLIEGRGVAELEHPLVVVRVSARALQLVGTWPSPEQLVDRLLEALAAAAEEASTADERSRARRALEALRDAGRDVLVNAAGGALGGTLT